MEDPIPTSDRSQQTLQEKTLIDLYKEGSAATNILDLSSLLGSILRSLAKLLKADKAILYLYDESKEEFIPPPLTVELSETSLIENMPRKKGSAFEIARTGQPLIATQVTDHQKVVQDLFEAESITSAAGFPLKVGKKTVGVLFLAFRDYHAFSLEDIEKIAIFANQAAIAIHNAELFKQEEVANKRLQLLLRAQEAIDSATELQEVLKQILTEGLRTVETERGSLMLIEGEVLVTKAQFGPKINDPGHKPTTFRVGEGIAGIVAEKGLSILCADVSKEPRFKKPPEGGGGFNSLLAVPIKSRDGNKVIGVISADDPQVNHFDQTHQQLLSDMAVQFATAIEKMMLVDTLRSLHQIFERITSVAIVGRELQPVLEEIAKNAIEVLKIDVITIYQYDPSQDKIIFPPLMKGTISQRQQMQTEVFKGEAPWVLLGEHKRHYYASDAPIDPIMNPQPQDNKAGFVIRERIKSSAGLLLKVGDEIVGIMFVNYRSLQPFLDRERQIMETFANSAAIAIQDARQWEASRRAQEQLIQAEKMSAVGTLASGVAHEIKNFLAIILSSIDLLEMGLVSGEEVPLKLADMKSEVHRARNIIDSLLNFVRPHKAARGPVDVLELMDESLKLLENQAKHVEIDRQLLLPVPVLQGNATTLKQVFFNILKNAIEAMPETKAGRLTVSTEADKVNVCIKIQDTGVGISSANKQRIFEPFFTTKEAGGGIGLGLAVSYKIVHDDHHGDIKVYSEEGKGSTFEVLLPIGG